MNLSASVLRLGRWTNRSAAAIDREIDEEFDFRVECRTQELIQSGMSPERAAREAAAQFGVREKMGKGMTSAAASRNGMKGRVWDASGKPIADAKVLLILKTWPNGRFQQQPSNRQAALSKSSSRSTTNQSRQSRSRKNKAVFPAGDNLLLKSECHLQVYLQYRSTNGVQIAESAQAVR